MDSHYLGYSVTGADLPYSSYPTVSSIPKRLFESLKFDSRNSPNSPSLHLLRRRASPYSVKVKSSTVRDSLSIRSGLPSFLPNAKQQNIRHALRELESALMAPDDDEEVTTSEPFLGENTRSQTPAQRSRSWNQEAQASHSRQSESPRDSPFGSSSNQVHIEKRHKGMEDFALQGVPPNNLKQLLIACARALSENKLDEFEKLVEHARAAVSISGEPIQRLGAYMVEGLIARKSRLVPTFTEP
ncbi:UNVERIFIED_CONTAM: Chitin-inducible gibberellin-responsive protein 1 [Sesamum radiatum]|uniref:Chitin-inducible gibberellin-responsive protein 1 n=1 Tax=Sesamum radiatum TaxID=300843 RepID=A0AAW2JCX1_SESRA